MEVDGRAMPAIVHLGENEQDINPDNELAISPEPFVRKRYMPVKKSLQIK